MKSVTLLFFVASLLLASSLVGAQIPSGAYDFIVVGAGAAGSVVAARLALETNKRILLLEGGAEGSGQRDIGGNAYATIGFRQDPATGKLVKDESYTIYDIPPMADLIRMASDALNNTWPINPTGPFFTQAKVIGGNQATNGLFWLCPQAHEFDAWGIPGFSGNDMRQYQIKVENATETGFGAADLRGTQGKVNVKYGSFTPNEQLKFKSAANAAGYPDAGDINKKETTAGVYHTQSNEKRGIRQSTSITHLLAALDSCGNRLTFRPSSTVTRVVFRTANNQLPTATGVEYVDDRGILYKATATSEVIIAAGDLQTAKILLNSGIGPKAMLTKYGKQVIVAHDMIGQKIRNHQRVTMTFNSSSVLPANFYTLPAAANEYARTGTGLLGVQGGYSLYLNAAGTADAIALLGTVAGSTPSPYQQIIGVTSSLNVQQYANGTVTLTSSDPLAPINFTTNALLVPEDQTRLAKAVLEARRVMKQWPGGPLPELTPGETNYKTVSDLIPWVKANVGTACHYYGSAPMGTVSTSPCDERMRVRNVKGLRLVGPAVAPGPIRLGMQCLAVLLGEKGTDLIKADNNC